jgi:ubiquinone/menaquinone biosynthesis C-methylase UbiE
MKGTCRCRTLAKPSCCRRHSQNSSPSSHRPRQPFGRAGGNGFEHVRPGSMTRLVGVDINPQYIEAASSRFGKQMPNLELYVADVQQPLPFEPVDLVYAALLFEYVELVPTLSNLRAVCRPNAALAVVLQLPSTSVKPVSPSPFTNLQSLASCMRLVSPPDFLAGASEVGFEPSSSRQVALHSGKEFLVLVFDDRSSTAK